MTEILTESFCERCGTRYTFESAKPRVRLKGVKVLSRGLKNFVLSDDTSIDEAMAAARSEADREASSHQLDAFHKTFNFCMSCRQYTCPNCWNEVEARCLSCAPLVLAEVAPVIEDLRELRAAALIGEPEPGNGAAFLEREDEAPASVEVEISAETPGNLDDVPAVAAESVGADLVDAGDWVADDGDAAGKAASQTLGLLQRFRPGQSLDAELDAYERERDEAAATDIPTEAPAATDDLAALQADRIAAAAGVDEPAAFEAAAPVEEPAVEPLEVAEVEAVAEPVTVIPPDQEPEPEPAPEQPAAPPIAAAAVSDVVEQPTWRITAPDPTAMPAAPSADQGRTAALQASGPPARPTTGETQWPAKPEWPNATGAAGLPFLGRPATPQGGMEALWAASNQELVTAPPVPGKAAATGIQPCISCGLSLSATARFCRRCGTPQSR